MNQIAIITFLLQENGAWRYRMHDSTGATLRESDDCYDLPTALEHVCQDVMGFSHQFDPEAGQVIRKPTRRKPRR